MNVGLPTEPDDERLSQPGLVRPKGRFSRVARKLRRMLRIPSSNARIIAALNLLRPTATGHPLIRLGGSGDGGYLVPNDLADLVACFSPGVGPVVEFELDLAENHALPCFLADASVDGPPQTHPLITFESLFVGSKTAETTVRLDEWVASKPTARTGDLLLQLDIEGAEYDVLRATSAETLRRFRIIVVEFHYLEKMLSSRALRSMAAIFRKLSEDFVVAHVHANNFGTVAANGTLAIPTVVEVTYLRRDRVRPGPPASRLPHRLDTPNCPVRPSIDLPEFWQPL